MNISDFDSYTFFPGQHWSHTWERQHELITRFANWLTGSDLYVCSPLGLINHNPLSKDFFSRIGHYIRSQQSEITGTQNPVRRNMKLKNVLHVPLHSSLTGKINYNLMKRCLRFSPKNNFFWSTYMNPTVYEFFKRSRFRVYDIAERRSKNPLLTPRILEWEKRAVAEADIVFADNMATIGDYESLNDIIYLPQGVNIDTFYELVDNREYIGYIGNLHFAIDYDFLAKLIELNKVEEFLIIGGILDDRAASILSYSNVKYIPQISKRELNQYLAKMKIGLIPYAVNEHTVGVYPTKLFEYLAANVPVLSTPLPEVKQYENKEYLKIMESPISLAGLSFTMKGKDRLIEANTWDKRWEIYQNEILRCLK